MWLHCYVALRAALGLLKNKTYTVEPRYSEPTYSQKYTVKLEATAEY